MADQRSIAAFAPDLMDQSKLRALPGLELVRRVDMLSAVSAEVVLVDLSRPQALEAVTELVAARRGTPPYVIGFGPHVESELLAAGIAAGCADVLARSVLFRRVAEGTLWPE